MIVALCNQQIEAYQARYTHDRVGVVTSYDPKTYSVKMTLQPEGWETGFVPLGTHHIGNGWGITMGAQVGDQFAVGFFGGDIEAPHIIGRVFSNQETPPMVQSGEMLLQHQSGSKHFLDKDGNITHVANKAYTLTSGKAVTINSGQPMKVTGGGDLS